MYPKVSSLANVATKTLALRPLLIGSGRLGGRGLGYKKLISAVGGATAVNG